MFLRSFKLYFSKTHIFLVIVVKISAVNLKPTTKILYEYFEILSHLGIVCNFLLDFSIV